jgi:hypothetical protein
MAYTLSQEMKKLLIPLFLMMASLASAAPVPTPDMALTIPFVDDKKTDWVMQYMDGNQSKIIAEFTPKGQAIEAWKEMLSQEITFTQEDLEKHLDKWKKMIISADPNVVITEEKKEEKLSIYSYRSQAFNEFSIRVFIRASDGIYAQAYHIRLDQPNEDRIKLWRTLIPKTSLMPNPQKK